MVEDQAILDAAMSVFARLGYDGATTKSIASAAGINEVTLFRKFRSKENILQAVITYNRDKALNTLDSIFFHREQETDLYQSLLRLSNKLLEFMNERADLMILLLAEGTRKPMVAKIISSIPKEMIKRLSKFFNDKIKQGSMRRTNPHLAATSFLGFLFYSAIISRVLEVEKAVHTFVEIFVRGISMNNTGKEK